MFRLVTLATATGCALFAATPDATAQLPTPTTCSEAKGACTNMCGRSIRANPGRNAPVDNCLRSCQRLQVTCLRSGNWGGRSKWSGLRRV